MSNTPPVTNANGNNETNKTPGFSTVLVAVLDAFGDGLLICIKGLPDDLGHDDLDPFVVALGFEANCIILSQSLRAHAHTANSPVYEWVPLYEWVPPHASAPYIRSVRS